MPLIGKADHDIVKVEYDIKDNDQNKIFCAMDQCNDQIACKENK